MTAEHDDVVSAEPEFWSFRPHGDGEPEQLLREMAALQRAGGATFFRATHTDDGFWMEGWIMRPAVQPPFNPPMTLAPQ